MAKRKWVQVQRGDKPWAHFQPGLVAPCDECGEEFKPQDLFDFICPACRKVPPEERIAQRKEAERGE